MSLAKLVPMLFRKQDAVNLKFGIDLPLDFADSGEAAVPNLLRVDTPLERGLVSGWQLQEH